MDVTHLTRKYLGTLLIGFTYDGQNHVLFMALRSWSPRIKIVGVGFLSITRWEVL